MAQIVTYETLREIQRNERKSEVLSNLDDEFYDSVIGYLNRELDSDFGRTEIRNAKNILHDIADRRERKILNQALRSARTGEKAELTAMTSRERNLFNSLIDILKQHRTSIGADYQERFTKKLDGEDRELQELLEEDIEKEIAKPKEEEKIRIKIKILEDLPEVVGSDLESYGPFKSGEVIELPKENADIFIDQGKAETIS